MSQLSLRCATIFGARVCGTLRAGRREATDSTTHEKAVMKKGIALKICAVLGVVALASGCVTTGKYKKEVAKVADLTAINQQLRSELSHDEATIKQLQDELKVTLLDSVLFDQGSAVIHKAGQQELARIAPTLAALNGARIEVRAFTDNVPVKAHAAHGLRNNMDLSSTRADNVVEVLSKKGVPVRLMSAQGFGENYPVANNSSAEGRAKNRRVEILITTLPITP